MDNGKCLNKNDSFVFYYDGLGWSDGIIEHIVSTLRNFSINENEEWFNIHKSFFGKKLIIKNKENKTHIVKVYDYYSDDGYGLIVEFDDRKKWQAGRKHS